MQNSTAFNFSSPLIFIANKLRGRLWNCVKGKPNANQIYIENRTKLKLGMQPNEAEWKRKIDVFFDAAIAKCTKKRVNVSKGQRKVRLFFGHIFAICRFPDDCTHKCIVTVVSFIPSSFIFSLFLFQWTRCMDGIQFRKNIGIFSDFLDHRNQWSFLFSKNDILKLRVSIFLWNPPNYFIRYFTLRNLKWKLELS